MATLKTTRTTELVTPIWIYTSSAVLQLLKCLLQIRRLGLPGWKSWFHREYFGLKTSNEIGNLQNDMVIFFLVYSFILMDPFPLRRGKVALCIVLIFPPFLFSLLPLNLGSEVFRRTLLGVSMLFCGCTIMELVRITCSHILKINLLKDSIYLILRFMVQLVAGTTHSMLLHSYLISKVFLGFRYLSLWTNHCDHLISSWQFCLHKGTFTILTAAIYSDIAT